MHQADKLGTSPEGYQVTAATDSAGAQVVVQEDKSDGVHLLSRPLKNHQDAVILGQEVVENGIDVYDNWMDLNEPGMDLFAIFGGGFR